MKKFIETLLEATSLIVGGAGVILVLIAIYTQFDQHVIRPYQRSEEAKVIAAEKETVNTDASNAAKLLASARKGCKIIGYEDVGICSGIAGDLPEERQSIGAAKEALTAREAYFGKCKKHYNESYCMDLIIRAYSIALRLQRENTQTTSP